MATFEEIEEKYGLWGNATGQLSSVEFVAVKNVRVDVQRGTPTWSDYPTTVSNGWLSELRLEQLHGKNWWLFSGYLDMCLRNSKSPMGELHVFFENTQSSSDQKIDKSKWIQNVKVFTTGDPIINAGLMLSQLDTVKSAPNVIAMPIAKAMFRDGGGRQHIFSITPAAAYCIYASWLMGIGGLDPRVAKIFIHVPKSSFIGKELRDDGLIRIALREREARSREGTKQ